MGYLTVTVAQYSLELNTSAILRHSIQSKLIRILDECQDLSGNWEEMIYLQFSGSEELNARKQCAINLHKRSRTRSDLTGRVSSLDFRFKWTFTLYLITGPYMSFMKAGRTWKLHPVTCWTVVIFDSPRCLELAINTPARHPRPPGTSSPRLARFSLTQRINLVVHSTPDLIWCVLKGCHVAV